MTRKSLRLVAVLAGSITLGAALWAQTEKKDEAPAAQPAADPNAVVITIGDQKITAADFSAYVASLPPDARQLVNGEKRRDIGEEMVKMKLLAGQARAMKLDEKPEFKQQLDIMRDNILVGLYLQQLQPTLVTEDDVKKYYDEHQADFEKITVRHILISTMSEKKLSEEEQKAKDAQAKAKADDLYAKIVKDPASFGTIAKEQSDDPGSKSEEGLLQPFTKNMMVKPFEEAAFALKKDGEISSVVKTDFGFHIIKLEHREIPKYDEAKEQLSDLLRQKKFGEIYTSLRTKAGAKLDEGFFGPEKKPEDKDAPKGDATPTK